MSLPRVKIAGRHLARLALSPAPLLLLPVLYLTTMAHGLVIGDPAEYTFVAHVLGIAHPPGYALITLLGKLFQTLIPFGEIPWRTHLLSVTAATVAALAVYGAAYYAVARAGSNHEVRARLAGLFAGFSAGLAISQWQHAIHTNPHIITAAFLAVNLFLLTRWWARDPDRSRDLIWFSLSAGLGVTHHPLTVFAFPAYALFILTVRPGILRQGRTLLAMVGCALLGLAVWLYYPVRSPMEPVFGPADMNTLDGFLNVALARGLRVNLFFFGLADQWDRARVFGSLLRLQLSLPTIALAMAGLTWLWRRAHRPLLLLYGLAFLGQAAFVINTVQDVIAYLLGPFLVVGLLAGIGLASVDGLLETRLSRRERVLLLATFILLGPALQLARNLPRVSLRAYDEGDRAIAALFAQFDGSGEGAVLLNDWERMTPLWYSRFVDRRWPDLADVRPEFVSTARPWLPSVFDTLPGGPVYLSGYRPEIVAAGFRLRPAGSYYQVVEPGDESVPAGLTRLPAAWDAPAVVAYDLPRQVTAGDFVPLTLALRAPAATPDFYVPEVQVGPVRFPFTTDSHVVSPLWLPGEVIVERFDFALPHDLAAGDYPVTVVLRNLSQGGAANAPLSLGTLTVAHRANPPGTGGLLANFRQRVGLAGAGARRGLARRQAPWVEPLPARPGDVIHLSLTWEALARAEESYTVFVHLIDAQDRPLVTLDYTPLGGAAPTHLWIPRWLPGQRYLDPYRLIVPPDLAPGTYRVEVGLYEMTGLRRLHLADATGNLTGDRYILGEVEVISSTP